jgi:putative hemin transport protein
MPVHPVPLIQENAMNAPLSPTTLARIEADLVATMDPIARRSALGLRAAHAELRAADPDVCPREASAVLGISEAELVASHCGEGATRLVGHWTQLFDDLTTLGPVTAVTRNAHAVHEKTGTYRNMRFAGQVGLVLDSAIDLRVFLGHWHHGFAVREETRSGTRDSLQFFDREGTAVHKVYLTEESHPIAYRALVGAHAAADQTPGLRVAPVPVSPLRTARERVEPAVDATARQDIHDFHAMLHRFAVRRAQALREGGEDLAWQIELDQLPALMDAVCDASLAIGVAVASPGVLQAHTGPIRRLVQTGAWLDVLDPDFNLHLRREAVGEAWAVRRPSRDGDVHALELYDRDGGALARLSGARRPGRPEHGLWRELVCALEPAA